MKRCLIVVLVGCAAVLGIVRIRLVAEETEVAAPPAVKAKATEPAEGEAGTAEAADVEPAVEPSENVAPAEVVDEATLTAETPASRAKPADNAAVTAETAASVPTAGSLETPARSKKRRPTMYASDNVQYNVSTVEVDEVDPFQVAETSATAGAAPGHAPSQTEAVVNMGYLFKNLPSFQVQREKLKNAIERADLTWKTSELEVSELRLKIRVAELEGQDSSVIAALKQELASKVETNDRTRESGRKWMLEAESGIYRETLNAVRSEVAVYARERGFRIVRAENTKNARGGVAGLGDHNMMLSGRRSADAMVGGGVRVSIPAMAGGATDTLQAKMGFDGADASPKSVREMLDEKVLYVDERVGDPEDITEEILKRLLAKEGGKGAKAPEATR